MSHCPDGESRCLSPHLALLHIVAKQEACACTRRHPLAQAESRDDGMSQAHLTTLDASPHSFGDAGLLHRPTNLHPSSPVPPVHLSRATHQRIWRAPRDPAPCSNIFARHRGPPLRTCSPGFARNISPGHFPSRTWSPRPGLECVCRTNPQVRPVPITASCCFTAALQHEDNWCAT